MRPEPENWAEQSLAVRINQRQLTHPGHRARSVHCSWQWVEKWRWHMQPGKRPQGRGWHSSSSNHRKGGWAVKRQVTKSPQKLCRGKQWWCVKKIWTITGECPPLRTTELPSAMLAPTVQLTHTPIVCSHYQGGVRPGLVGNSVPTVGNRFSLDPSQDTWQLSLWTLRTWERSIFF